MLRAATADGTVDGTVVCKDKLVLAGCAWLYHQGQISDAAGTGHAQLFCMRDEETDVRDGLVLEYAASHPQVGLVHITHLLKMCTRKDAEVRAAAQRRTRSLFKGLHNDGGKRLNSYKAWIANHAPGDLELALGELSEDLRRPAVEFCRITFQELLSKEVPRLVSSAAAASSCNHIQVHIFLDALRRPFGGPKA
jgi:hypothetical protein